MPTPYKTTENMTKHLTKAERKARQVAEQGTQRGRTYLKAPKWLDGDARKIFEATKKRAREYGVIESVDVDLLALYANAVHQAQRTIDPKDAQSWHRVALSYAEKLGLTATGRARLAKKKADAQPVDDFEQLLDDVTEYVNGNVR